jgi:hypothetical protein
VGGTGSTQAASEPQRNEGGTWLGMMWRTDRMPTSATSGWDDAAAPCMATSGERRELNGAVSGVAAGTAVDWKVSPVAAAFPAAAGSGTQTAPCTERRRRSAAGDVMMSVC